MRAWVEVDLGALTRNGATIAAHAGVPLLPMVKADAYGLGAVPVARALETLDPWGYGVATLAEGEQLRAAGIARPLVLFTPVLAEELAAVHRAGLVPALGARALIERWRAVAGDAPWFLSIDTGMSRSGIMWDAVRAIGDLVSTAPPLGAFTHFHSAERNDGSRDLQEQRFEQAVAALPVRPALVHCENGPAVQRVQPSRWSLVRPGVFLYGVSEGDGARILPEPVASIRARVVEIREVADGETVSYGATYRAVGRRRIATLPIGYADGYRRAFGNRGAALVRGRRACVAGIVTMDMTMLDVTDVPCEIGDVATLLGRDGDASLAIDEVARTAELSPYELLTGLRQRMPRVYVGGAA